jgi:proteic killer suppression protein
LASYETFSRCFTLLAPLRHMHLPGFRLHPLKGALNGFWAVTVRANWRVIFRFDAGAEDVDYVDYH